MTAEDLAALLVAELRAAGQRVATAESCTGGWLAKRITDIPGSSECFEYGWVSYANNAKSQMLGVDPDTINAFGAVSAPVVRAMAEGALAASGADFAVAVSGVAGPGGGTADKPVGLVWFGFAVRTGDTSAQSRQFAGDRTAVRHLSCEFALEGVRSRL